MSKPISKQIGGLTLAFTYEFDKTWKDKGSGADKDIAFFQPKCPDKYVALGSVSYNKYESIDKKMAALIVKKDTSGNEAPMKHPIDYIKVWTDKGSGADQDGSCWTPVAPDGYVSMGDVVVRNHSKPDTDLVVCIREDLATEAIIGDQIWKDKGSGADKDFSIYGLTPPDKNLDNSHGYYTANTFVGNESHSKPKSSKSAHCLKLEIAVIKANEPQAPKLTSANKPVDSTPAIVDRTIEVPFTTVVDDSKDIEWQVDNSPFYTIQRTVSFVLDDYINNISSSESQTNSVAVTTGVSNTDTETWTETTGITVSYQTGITLGAKPFGLGVEVSSQYSASITHEMGWSESKSVTELKQTEITENLTATPYSAAARWSNAYNLVVRRANGDIATNQININVQANTYSTYTPENKKVAEPA